MRRMGATGLFLVYLSCVALWLYEVTAKSPELLGAPLPGWGTTCQVEKATPWNPSTGLQPLDKILHETQEAYRFYGLLAGLQHRRQISPASTGTIEPFLQVTQEQ
ncbi:MAG: hypothetical protein KOO60_10070 [Gemmatimonadales bacterium]|nr:hypothetical protein [Gemmatimonadales bacterium]